MSKCVCVKSSCKLYNRVRYYRRRHLMSQSELAAYVGVSKNTICSIENYEFYPAAYLALKLAFAFGVQFEDIFSLTPFPESDVCV